MDEEVQEALSAYQALSIRLLLLASGKWAIVYGDRQVEITQTLDEGWMRSTAWAERDQYEARRAQAREKINAVVAGTLEDLGL